jgi:hypothetical protein
MPEFRIEEHFNASDFTAWPAERRAVACGLNYNIIDLPDRGVLYVTRYGWPFLPALLPDAWYANRYFVKKGYRLPGATGTVYRLASATPRVPLALVIKVARVGQPVPLNIAPEMRQYFPEHVISEARFLGPFEEFGICQEIRAGRFGPPDIRLYTKRPLAIYQPPEEYELWQTGRSEIDFARAPAGPTNGGGIALDIRRDYLLIYNWIAGYNAQECLERGLLEAQEFADLVPRASTELQAKGFRMLDIKPLHLVLRPGRKTGRPLRRRGKLVYALIDYELVVRTSEYARFLG